MGVDAEGSSVGVDVEGSLCAWDKIDVGFKVGFVNVFVVVVGVGAAEDWISDSGVRSGVGPGVKSRVVSVVVSHCGDVKMQGHTR